jgi:hypothetical protein
VRSEDWAVPFTISLPDSAIKMAYTADHSPGVLDERAKLEIDGGSATMRCPTLLSTSRSKAPSWWSEWSCCWSSGWRTAGVGGPSRSSSPPAGGSAAGRRTPRAQLGREAFRLGTEAPTWRRRGWVVGRVPEASWTNASELGAVPAQGSGLSAGAPVR